MIGYSPSTCVGQPVGREIAAAVAYSALVAPLGWLLVEQDRHVL